MRCTRCAHGDRPSLGREARAGRGGALQTDHRVTPWHGVHAVRKIVPRVTKPIKLAQVCTVYGPAWTGLSSGTIEQPSSKIRLLGVRSDMRKQEQMSPEQKKKGAGCAFHAFTRNPGSDAAYWCPNQDVP